MEHYSKPSQATAKNQKVRYLPENAIDSYDTARNILFFDEFDSSVVVADLQPKFLFSKQINSSYSTETDCYTSRVSQPDRNNFENVSFTEVFGDKKEHFKNLLSSSSVEIGDELFFSSDVGKEMLLKDEEDYEREFMCKNDGATCSSWKVNTRDLTHISLLEDGNLSKQRRYSVGEYIRKLSGPLGSLSSEECCRKVYFGCNATTPMPNRNAPIKLSEIDNFQFKYKAPACVPLHDDISNLNIKGQDKCITPFKDGPLPQMFLYSAKKTDCSMDYKRFIGGKIYEDILRIEAEEKRNCLKSVAQLPFTSSTPHITEGKNFGFPHESGMTILENTTVTCGNASLGDGSITEKWIVQPQELILDLNSKGCRILLTSNCKADLKFKIKFDSKITNVCPISGTLPAKGEIGLRILVSGYIKKNFKNDTEDAIIITCAKKEKAVPIKVCRRQKSKGPSLKKRTYICF